MIYDHHAYAYDISSHRSNFIVPMHLTLLFNVAFLSLMDRRLTLWMLCSDYCVFCTENLLNIRSRGHRQLSVTKRYD